MPKWLTYIALILICTPFFLSAKTKNAHFYVINDTSQEYRVFNQSAVDTTKNNKKDEQEDKKKIKEVAPARKQPKPEKVEPADEKANGKETPKSRRKARRQQRPQGMERPPEIPRHNGN